MSRWKLVLLGVLAAPLIAFGFAAAAWALFGPDDEAVTVAPNVSLAGDDVSGASRAALTSSIARATKLFAATKVEIATPQFTIDTTAGELGLTIDEDATVDAAMAVGRADPGPLAPLRWVKSFATDRRVPIVLTVDRATANRTIVAREGARRAPPVEPTMKVGAQKVELVPGAAGHALDVDEIVDRVPGGLSRIGRTIRIETEPRETKPKLADADVATVVDHANRIASHPLTLKYDRTSTEVKGSDLRSGLKLDTSGPTPKLALDDAYVAGLLAHRLRQPANPTGVRFEIVNGVPTPSPGHDAVVCCDDKAPAAIVAAFLDGKSQVTLGTRSVTAAEGVAWAKTLGVKEVVGEFTTRHPCCQPRVTNIHKMSDITRGALIAPGETFSANEFVGKRTQEKGFVSAPVIEEGQFSEDFGGGVSQWATTTFNAAFFAGLDIPQHKAHSIYISRYPFGREATLAYPSVDLKIRNNTPYGVVIYPTYTDSSITVQLWSTRFATGTQSAINKSSGCGNVVVTRTRQYVDGRTENDKFRADYNCNPPKHP